MRAFITGASRGIGSAITQALLDQLTEVTILAKDGDRLTAMQDDITASKPDCVIQTIAVDLSDLVALHNALRSWQQERGDQALDVVVLNAGAFTEGTLTEIPVEDYLRDLNINLNACLVIIQEVVAYLRSGTNPRLFIVGSTAAYQDYPEVPSYGVAKAALRSLALNLRTELASDGIGVTFLAPGPTLTDMWAGTDIPAASLLEPNDIGKLVAACLTLSPQAVVDEIIIRPMRTVSED